MARDKRTRRGSPVDVKHSTRGSPSRPSTPTSITAWPFPADAGPSASQPAANSPGDDRPRPAGCPRPLVTPPALPAPGDGGWSTLRLFGRPRATAVR